MSFSAVKCCIAIAMIFYFLALLVGDDFEKMSDHITMLSMTS